MRAKIGLILIALLVIGIVATAISQPMKGRGKMNRPLAPQEEAGQMGIKPPLSAEQTEQISVLRIDHQKATIDLRADLEKKQLDLHTLMNAAEPDQKEIYAVIEEMGALRTRLHKERVSHWLKVQKVLTPEQRAALKARDLRLGRGHGRRPRRQGQGYGPARDMGPCWE